MRNNIVLLVSTYLFFLLPIIALADQGNEENWSLHYQATVIGQGDLKFHSPYSGQNSLSPGEISETVTTTFFLGVRIWKGGELYINPEISQGKGLSDTLGVAGFPNGEGSRAGKVQSSLLEGHFIDNNVARCFLRQNFDLSDSYEHVDSDQNQLAGDRAVKRITVTVGKMSVTDIFDDNLYSHDARSQFMNWGLVSNGAWDYPANAKGYTNGLTVEYIQPSYSVRSGVFMVSTIANGEDLEYRFWKAFGQANEVEKPYSLYGHPGKVRLLGYINRAHMGSYEQAINSRDINITESRKYRFKYGAGINIEQEITKFLGSFIRLGWDDGKTETWEYTEIDRTVSFGLSLKGILWSRPEDTVGLAELINGLSHDHRRYLEEGGLGFIIGDGKLNYAYEKITEFYYNIHLIKGFFLTFDYQFLGDPAYNADRGPVSVFSGRFHYQF